MKSILVLLCALILGCNRYVGECKVSGKLTSAYGKGTRYQLITNCTGTELHNPLISVNVKKYNEYNIGDTLP